MWLYLTGFCAGLARNEDANPSEAPLVEQRLAKWRPELARSALTDFRGRIDLSSGSWVAGKVGEVYFECKMAPVENECSDWAPDASDRFGGVVVEGDFGDTARIEQRRHRGRTGELPRSGGDPGRPTWLSARPSF